jgi:hypothetical protein
MKTFLKLAAIMTVLATLQACAYGGATSINKGKNVLITRNDLCLYGALRKVYVCKVGKGAISNCKETVAP